MTKKIINLHRWVRIQHFRAFMQMDQPHFSICSSIDISNILNSPVNLFSFMLFCIHNASASVEEFGLRLHKSGEGVDLYKDLDISFNILAKDNLFSNHRMSVSSDYKSFDTEVKQAIKNKNNKGEIEIDPSQDEGMILTSCLPWIHFSSLSEPVFNRFDSIPRVTWGKYNSKGELPISVQVHHALMDGIHVANFFENLQAEINSFG